MLDGAPSGGHAVAEVPGELRAARIRVAGERRVEDGGAAATAVGADDLDARRLDHGDGGLGGVERAAGRRVRRR